MVFPDHSTTGVLSALVFSYSILDLVFSYKYEYVTKSKHILIALLANAKASVAHLSSFFDCVNTKCGKHRWFAQFVITEMRRVDLRNLNPVQPDNNTENDSSKQPTFFILLQNFGYPSLRVQADFQ